MDTIHDLGGREGFGPIKPDKYGDAVQFHADWEGRSYAIWSQMFARWRNSENGPNVDWFRHVRERIDPVDYLTRPYFDQWVQSIAAMLVEEGAISLKDVTGKDLPDLKAVSSDNNARVSDNQTVDQHIYEVGQLVIAKRTTATPYTRLPSYIRGRTGTVVLKHGLQPLADLYALGVEQEEQLYTVAFEANELWPDAENTGHRVCIDLWESHLEPGS